MQADESRTVRLAARAAREPESELQRRLAQAVTHLRIDAGTPGAFACAEVLIDTLQRGPGHLSIDPATLDPPQVERLRAVAARVRPDRPVSIGVSPLGATRITVGQARGDIVVLPDAHGARLARGTPPTQRRPPSRLGIVYAAAVAAGEVFKEAAAISQEYCRRQRAFSFCPVTLTSDLEAAPSMRGDFGPTVTLAGMGAIGTAHALILRGLATQGAAVVIDRERFASENLGTYSLGGAHDVAQATPKVDLALRALSGWRHYRHVGMIADAVEAVDAGELPWTPIALSGLDNHAARRDAQRLQCDRLLDAATGDTAVGLRDTRPDGPCLVCMLPSPARRSATEALVKLGIPIEIARAPGDAVVDAALIAGAASEEAREILTAQRGTAICGLMRAAGVTDLDEGDYRPSVPFVSQQAACLSIGRLLAIEAGIDEDLPNFFQYDTLLGPDAATRQRRRPSPDCGCQRRSGAIAQVRRERRAGLAA